MKYYLFNTNSEDREGYSIYYTTLVVAQNKKEAIEQFVLCNPYATAEDFENDRYTIFQCEAIVDYKYVERDEYEAESKVNLAKLKERVDEMIREAILRKSQ
jgi:hypothetical protein